MKEVDVAGLKVFAGTKAEFLSELAKRLRTGRQTFVTTLYSEFLYASLRSDELRQLLNRADMAAADGIAILWASRFLSLPLTVSGYWAKILQAKWQVFRTGLGILLNPISVKKTFPEKIVGAELFWDLGELAEKNDYSVYLLGGHGETPRKVEEALLKRYPSLRVAGFSNKNFDDPSIVEDVKKAAPDILMVAFGPLRQEQWIAKNLPNLPVKLSLGLGGTFDYVAGKRLSPPKFLRKIGLEWLWRLITQPYRIKRIFQATFGLVFGLIKYKVFESLPYRRNVVSVVVNDKDEVFVARFNPNHFSVKALGDNSKAANDYWQLPQGGIDPGESVEEAASRELWEETAIHNVKFIKLSDHKYTYRWKTIGQRPLFIRKRFRFRGQEQQIVFFRFTGTDKEIHLDQYEFLEYKWVPYTKLLSTVHPHKYDVTKLAFEDLKSILEVEQAAQK